MNQRHASIVIVQEQMGPETQVHVHGDLVPHLIDLALDEAKRQIGTYEETPLDAFLQETGIKMFTIGLDGGGVRVGLEASLRDPGTLGGLLRASAEGRTPAEARRKLAELISGGTLVLGAMLPISRDVPVPDLTGRKRE